MLTKHGSVMETIQILDYLQVARCPLETDIQIWLFYEDLLATDPIPKVETTASSF